MHCETGYRAATGWRSGIVGPALTTRCVPSLIETGGRTITREPR